MVKRYDIKFLVYEGVFYDNNAETYKKLSKIQGEIESYALRHNLGYEEFPITEWRSYLPLEPKTKRRSDIKKAVHEYVNKLYPDMRDELEDVKEAFCLGLAWVAKQNKLMEKVNYNRTKKE